MNTEEKFNIFQIDNITKDDLLLIITIRTSQLENVKINHFVQLDQVFKEKLVMNIPNFQVN